VLSGWLAACWAGAGDALGLVVDAETERSQPEAALTEESCANEGLTELIERGTAAAEGSGPSANGRLNDQEARRRFA
jgi:hypothetical protein